MQDCPALSKFSAHQIDGHHDNSDERLENGVLGMIEVLERQRLTKDQRRIILTMRESAQAAQAGRPMCSAGASASRYKRYKIDGE